MPGAGRARVSHGRPITGPVDSSEIEPSRVWRPGYGTLRESLAESVTLRPRSSGLTGRVL